MTWPTSFVACASHAQRYCAAREIHIVFTARADAIVSAKHKLLRVIVMRKTFLVLSAVCFSGCSEVPALEEATGTRASNVMIADVVHRVKCELALALKEKGGDRRFAWMNGWTIKTDLTLQANQQGSITPNGSYTVWRGSAVNSVAGPTSFPGATLGTFQQFFTFGVNAGAQGQAVRAELLSFSLSIAELNEWWNHGHRDQSCKVAEKRGLLGNLGLREWVDAALYPVERKELFAGHHKGSPVTKLPGLPGFVGAPSKPGAAAASLYSLDKDVCSIECQKLKSEMAQHAIEALKSSDQAVYDAAAVRRILKSVEAAKAKIDALQMAYGPVATSQVIQELRKSLAGLVELQKVARLATEVAEGAAQCKFTKAPAPTCADVLTPGKLEMEKSAFAERSCATLEAAKAECAREAADGLADGDTPSIKIHLASTIEAARAAKLYAEHVKRVLTFAEKEITPKVPDVAAPDPPIDSIGHTVQFVVSYSASVSPSWTLLAWKGPALSGPTAALVSARSHLLQLVLSPGPATVSSKVSKEQERVLFNQSLLLR